MRFIKTIKTLLENYKQIYLLDLPPSECSKLLKMAGNILHGCPSEDILFLTVCESCETTCTPFSIRLISAEEMDEAVHLYNMYEFSDRFHIIRHNYLFGSLFNCRDAGILSDEELYAALFA